MRSWEDVHRLQAQERRSIRDISRELGMSRNTVRRLLALPEPPRYCRRDSPSLLDPFREAAMSLLGKDPTMPATRIRRVLAEMGYSGGITILKEYLATVRPSLSEEDGEQSEPLLVMLPHSRDAGGPRYDPRRAGDDELGMNMMSTGFEIIMVNRANQRLFRKPMNEMLGRKCYEEFEHRADICPHCPGAAALATGRPHRVETKGIRDDGTRYAVRLTAYPILGPCATPVGFVETEEDITEQKRAEKLAHIFEDLPGSLHAAYGMRSAVRQALNIAFTLEGVDFGCAYIRHAQTGEYRAVAQRGMSRDLAERLLGPERDKAATSSAVAAPVCTGPPGPVVTPSGAWEDASGPDRAGWSGPHAVALVPILDGSDTIARLLLGSSSYPEFPAATLAALEGLGRMLSSAIAISRADELQEKTRAGVEDLLRELPVPVWRTDAEGRFLAWNPAAERELGWRSSEVVGLPASALVAPADMEPADGIDAGAGQGERRHLVCRTKSGETCSLEVSVLAAERVLGPESGVITIVREWTNAEANTSAHPASQIARAPGRPSMHERIAQPHLRVLLVEEQEDQRTTLKAWLHELGCLVKACVSAEQGLRHYHSSAAKGRPFDVVVSPVVRPSGLGGLELANRVRAAHHDVRVILTSGAPIVGWESHGFAGFLLKPFSEEQVRDLVGRLLNR